MDAASANMLPHIAARLIGSPIAMRACKLQAIMGALAPRLGLSAEGFRAQDSQFPADRAATSPGVAVIPVVGSLVARGLGGVEAMSGLAGYQQIGAALQDALADPEVSGILLDIDSYGGEVQGMLELAGKIRAARGRKPIAAVANGSAYSAAYALASAADRLFVTVAGGVGSIGVVAVHVDHSEADKAEGLAYTFVHAGATKVDGNPHAPLADSARAGLQAEVNRLYGLFVQSVAADGRVSEATARTSEARTFHGEQAVAAGLADAVGTFEEALAWVANASAQPTANPFGQRPAWPRSA
jgi:signal peptide peptidase SppA